MLKILIVCIVLNWEIRLNICCVVFHAHFLQRFSLGVFYYDSSVLEI